MNNIKTLRYLAIAEGISYLLFALTMPLKYMMEITMPNKIVGMAHGVLFIAYCVWVIIASKELEWRPIRTLLALGASLLPFATFVVDSKWLKGHKETSSNK